MTTPRIKKKKINKQKSRAAEMSRRSKFVLDNQVKRNLALALANLKDLVCLEGKDVRKNYHSIRLMGHEDSPIILGYTNDPSEIQYIAHSHGFRTVNHKLPFTLPVIVRKSNHAE